MENKTQDLLGADITITEKAATQISSILASQGKKGYGLRISVTGGGCSGMNYNLTFDNKETEYDKIFTSQGVTVYCDLKSFLYLKGVEIDYSTNILSGGFKINNPNAKRTCGCGTSFSA